MELSSSLPRLMAVTVFVASLSLNAAGLSLTGTVTPLVGSYLYELEIANAGPDDYSLVSIVDAPPGDPLIGGSLTTPAGFLGSYDSGLGFVDFIEFTDFFAAGTSIGGFSFESLAGPIGAFSVFEALTTLGNSARGDITWEVRSGPPVPEPRGGLIPIVALGLLWIAASQWLRRSNQTA